MEILGLREADIRSNRPIELFSIDGKACYVKLLSVEKSEEWLEIANEVAEAERVVQEAMSGFDPEAAKAAHKEFRTKLREAVLAYPGVGAEAREKATWAQLMGAFWKLKSLNDPFDFSQAMTLESTRERIEKLPKGALELAMQKVGAKATSSASSGNGTE